MATRYIGDAVVRIRYDDAGDYRGTVSVKGHRWSFRDLHAPRAGFGSGVSYDGALAYDEMAQSAVSFGSYYTRHNRGDDVPDWAPSPEVADAISDAVGWAQRDDGSYEVRRSPKGKPVDSGAEETGRMVTMASKAMTKHKGGTKKYSEAMENGPKTTGLLWVVGFAALGAIIGAVRGAAGMKGSAALAAAEQGVGLATVGGTVVGFMSESMRNSGFATAGIGLISIMGLGLVQYVTTPSTAATPAAS